ncbi:MAG: FMN-binding negative transcriptional regulator [Nitrososphaerales archaeon]
MYNPKWFKEDRLELLHAEIKEIGFGTLVTTTKASGIMASHIPVMLDPEKGERGTLFGHIARGNAQWRDTMAGSEALVMFLGPDAYITPRWYETKKQGDGRVVPTWNYVAVHARGPITFFDDSERLKDAVTRLTRHHESGVDDPWEVRDAPAEYIEAQLKTIVGFELPITKMEGKRKMSQNRPEADYTGVVSGLEERGVARDLDVSREMRANKP